MAQELGGSTNMGVDVDGDGRPDFHLTLKINWFNSSSCFYTGRYVF